MSVRSVMTMRARVVRDIQTTEDAYGQKGPPLPAIVGVLPCRIWFSAAYLAIRNQSTVSARDLTMIVPLESDIQVNDKIDTVCDRRGNELLSNLRVEASMRRKNHIECRLQSNA